MSKKIIACMIAVILICCTVTGCKISAQGTDVDVDLTQLSKTLVYTEVYSMLTEPDEYEGKTVRMKGTFVAYSNDEGTKYYPALLIKDALACCAQGMEFVLKDEPPYPGGYPEQESELTVVGTFEKYQEAGIDFCHLVDARIEAVE